MGMFFLLVWLWCLALKPYYTNPVKRKKVFVQVFAAAVLYGIAMEFVQRYWVINRSFDTGDIIADAAGSALGLWFCVGRYIKK
jgi:VanZ family protein